MPAFDLAIADEAHRCAGKRDSVFATILDGDRIRASRRLFATATPKIQRKKSGDSGEFEDVADMSNKAVFGKVFHRLTLGSAIRRGILSDYRVYITQVDDPGLHSSLNSKDDSVKVQRRRAVQVSMLKTISEYGLRRVVTFHNRVDDAKLYAAELSQVAAAVAGGRRPAVMPETVDYVSGKMSAGARKQKLETFRENGDGTCHVLSNARCLSEGVDVPDIDGIVFVDPRDSETDIVQAVGRAIRKHDSKDYGAIVIPVFMGKGQTASDAIEESSFKHVVAVLNALRAHDMEFGASLDAMWQRRATGGKPEGSADDPFAKIKFDLKGVLGLDQVLRPILLESLTDLRLVYARSFFEEHGHLRVPQGYKFPDGYALYSAMLWLRICRRNGTLASDQIAAFDEMGFMWEPNRYAGANAEKMVRIRAFFEEHGHLRVPQGYKFPDGYALFSKMHELRTSRKRGTLTLLPEQLAELVEMGFQWELLEEKFRNGVDHLMVYVEEHGDCMVPEGYKTPGGFQLAQWVSYCRRSKKSGRLSPERIAVLDKLGFLWNVLDATFQKKLDYIRAFFEEHGHTRVPYEYKSPDGYPTGAQVSRLRVLWGRGVLSLERIAALNELGFSFELNQYDGANAKKMVLIRAFFEEHGHLRVPWGYKASDGYDLYLAMHNMRNSRQRGSLSLTPEQIAELDEMGFEWMTQKTQQQVEIIPDIILSDLADRLKNEEAGDDLPELMAQHGCDLEESRALIEAENFDDALQLLEDATGESLRRNRP